MKFLQIINKISVFGKYLAFLTDWIDSTKEIADLHFGDKEKAKDVSNKE